MPEIKSLSVVEAAQKDLERLALRAPELADSTLAATALKLAAEIDAPGNSATSKSMCAARLLETMDRLRELAPPEVAGDKLDDLTKRREKKRKTG